jgi:hypothetical protein
LEVSTFGGNFSWVLNYVPSNSDADSLCLLLLGAIGDHNSWVCCPAVVGNVCVLDEAKRVDASVNGYSCGW